MFSGENKTQVHAAAATGNVPDKGERNQLVENADDFHEYRRRMLSRAAIDRK
jgi:hypothetical protein